MSDVVAFELRSDHSKESADEDSQVFSGGVVNLPGGESFDVAEALEEGNGTIVLNPVPKVEGFPKDQADEKKRQEEYDRAVRDERIVATLDGYPALKRAAVPGQKDAASTKKAAEGRSKGAQS